MPKPRKFTAAVALGFPVAMIAATDTVFYGTSNPAAMFWGEDRKGDNLYTRTTVLALEPKTGKLKWYRQEIEHDLWDYDSAYEMPALNRGGKDLLVHLNKSGFVFVMDKHRRQNRKRLAAGRKLQLRQKD